MARINLQIDELIGFIAVVEKLNFKAAAEDLFISQPALSRRIERLESAVGSRLLERTTRCVSLTAAGRQFLPHACSVIEELEMAIQGLSSTAIQRSGLVTVACIPSLTNEWLPSVLQDFTVHFPQVRIKLIDENAGGVLDSVVAGIADFGLNFIGAQEVDVEFKGIYDEFYVLAVPRDHVLAKQDSVSWEDLANERLISMSPSSGNRAVIDSALSKLRNRPRIFYEANHVASVLGLVATGLGVAAVPSLAISKKLHPGLIGVPLTGPQISRTIGLISRKGAVLQPAAKTLFDMLKKGLSSIAPSGA